MCEDNPGCGCQNVGAGNPVQIWPGWITNEARNNGADEWPTPFIPRRHGNHLAYQLQLKNGWEDTNFGLRLSYDSYRAMLSSSGSANTMGKRNNLTGRNPAAFAQPSRLQLQDMISAGAPNDNLKGGVGDVIPDLTNRRYYG